MATHLRRWWLAYTLLWLILASTTSLEGGHTALAQGALITGILLATLTGLVLTLRRTARTIRRAAQQLHRRRRATAQQ